MNKKIRPFYKLIIPSSPSKVEKRDFLTILNKTNTEIPLQSYLSRHPAFFLRMLPYGRQAEIYDRPKLGSEYIPDFLLNIENSQGKCWACVELESPIHNPLTARGNISSKLNEAIGQINDWREWLKNNIAYAQKELALKGINSNLNTWIIIGRRQNFNERQKRRYVALKNLGINVLSYDRLLD
jgi:hypothetical protein